MGRGPEADLSALADVVDRLRCPVCTLPLTFPAEAPTVLGCPHGHRFDVARQGHVVLVPGGSRLRADTADMVAARERVLASGTYDPVRDGLLTAVGVPSAGARPEGLVLDCGAGTGAYTAAVLDAHVDRRGVALELSVPALRRAARAHPRLAAVGADLTRPLPLADGAAALVLAVFAPLPADDELRRVTATGSRLVVLTPTPAHLAALRARLDLLDVPAGKPGRLVERLARDWEAVGRVDVEVPVTLTPELARDVVAMGPNAWHATPLRAAALTALPGHLPDTLAVTVTTLARR